MIVKKTKTKKTRLNIQKRKTKHKTKTKTILKLLKGGQNYDPPPLPSLGRLQSLVKENKRKAYEIITQFSLGTGYHPNDNKPPPLLPRTAKAVVAPAKLPLPPTVTSLVERFRSMTKQTPHIKPLPPNIKRRTIPKTPHSPHVPKH